MTDTNKYYRVIGLKPGPVVLEDNTSVDLAKPLSDEQISSLVATNFPYIELTEEGLKKFKKSVPANVSENAAAADNSEEGKKPKK